MAQSDVFLRHRIHVAWPVLNSVNKADTPGCVRVCVCVCACVLSGWSQLRPLCRSAELSAAAPCYLILALSLLGRKARLFPTLGEHVVPGMNRDPEAPPLLVTRHFSLSLSLSLSDHEDKNKVSSFPEVLFSRYSTFFSFLFSNFLLLLCAADSSVSSRL